MDGLQPPGRNRQADSAGNIWAARNRRFERRRKGSTAAAAPADVALAASARLSRARGALRAPPLRPRTPRAKGRSSVEVRACGPKFWQAARKRRRAWWAQASPANRSGVRYVVICLRRLPRHAAQGRGRPTRRGSGWARPVASTFSGATAGHRIVQRRAPARPPSELGSPPKIPNSRLPAALRCTSIFRNPELLAEGEALRGLPRRKPAGRLCSGRRAESFRSQWVLPPRPATRDYPRRPLYKH